PFKLYHNCQHIPLGHNTEPVGTGHSPVRDPIGQILLDTYGLTRQSHSIPVSHPMLKFIPTEETHTASFYTSILRPVPSGGALFPGELYLLVVPPNRRGSTECLWHEGQGRHEAPDGGKPHPPLQDLSAPSDGPDQHLPAGLYHYDV